MFPFLFELIAKHNCWMLLEKSTRLITALLGQAINVLYGVLKAATYKETLPALEDRFMDQYLAPRYCNQLKTKTQGV
jgi:hypothetical protein